MSRVGRGVVNSSLFRECRECVVGTAVCVGVRR